MRISFEDMHIEELATQGKVSIYADSKVLKVTKSQGSGQRQIASHKKYVF